MEDKINRIVVFGGSFNPPTVAHEKLLAAAMDGTGADKGIFVPSNDAYVTKKMSKTDWPKEVLPERTRSAMLKAVCKADGRFALDEGEYGFSGTSGNSLDTMKRIQSQYPDAALYFLFGGDKLKVFAKWKTFREFCGNYGIIVFRREDSDPEDEIGHTKALGEFRDSFVILPAPDGIGGISSAAVRDAVRAGDGEKAKSMLSPGVYELLKGGPIRRETAITSFRGKYAFLSNFYAAEVTYDGLTYPTNEAAFQAAKCLNPEERIPFTETKNPVVVKRMGRQVKLRSDWNFVKLGIMEKIVRAKFEEHPDLAEQLVATGDLPIMEGNNWHDTFWGVDAATGRGENHLGEILMKVRVEHGGKMPAQSGAEAFQAEPAGKVRTPAPPKGPAPAPAAAAEAAAAAEKKEEAPAGNLCEVGMTVRHPAFGTGSVVAVNGTGLSRIVDVEFPSVGLKHLGAAWVEKNCKLT